MHCPRPGLQTSASPPPELPPLPLSPAASRAWHDIPGASESILNLLEGLLAVFVGKLEVQLTGLLRASECFWKPLRCCMQLGLPSGGPWRAGGNSSSGGQRHQLLGLSTMAPRRTIWPPGPSREVHFWWDRPFLRVVPRLQTPSLGKTCSLSPKGFLSR